LHRELNTKSTGLSLHRYRPKVPEADEALNPRNPIDHFIFTTMEKVGLEPNAEASKEALLKRVSMDITGLPPTVEQQERFLADKSPNAYEKIVDELLVQQALRRKNGHPMDGPCPLC